MIYSNRLTRKLGHVALTLLVLLSTVAFGGTAGIDFAGNLSGISETICNAANFLYGPVGWGIMLLMLVLGIIRWITGMHGGVGVVIGAVVGAFVLLALPAIMSALTFGTCVLGAAGA